MKKILILMALISIPAMAGDIGVRIQAGSRYKDYSNEELRRRVWELERAVEKLQDQVFQLAMNNGGSHSNMWTCKIQSFGKTHVATGNTKAAALAQVLKKCSDATNAIHCDEDDANCGND